ncbi:MAG: 4-aminobutyrate--2-oxoglutarate transaminase [Chromatiales bacterium]|jgi:4-aminobutyrate aminotransferase/(S)-3-amino-2-methylpropionate transaminase|nr:MAG: 4-aminobutyrate--2-oxoglutarate transaminase [Chromatiales bacterium]
MSSNQELHKRREQAMARGMPSQLPVYIDRAANAELWDVEGRRYIDFGTGIAVLNTGHLHAGVQAAVRKQLERFSHTCFMVTPYESAVALAEKLNALAPGKTPKKTLLVTTGAEAVENAVKIARVHTGRTGVISFGGSFHGRTLLAMGLTGKTAPYKSGFGPFPAELHHAPFPIAYHGISVADSLAGIESLFAEEIEPTRVAAIIVEPVQGEGGFYIAPPEFLRALRELCDRHGIVMIADEIQTGFGRTGRMFAMEHSGVEPDLMTVAKSLAGGFPLAGVIGKAAIMDAPAPGGLGGTYAASPIGCSAALAVLEAMEAEKLPARANHIGELITGRLRELAQRFDCIGDVRGLGAMVAMELVKGGNADLPEADLTRDIVQAAARNGLVLLSCGRRKNVLRFLVALTATDTLISEGLDILERTLAELCAESAPPGRRRQA